MKLFKKVSIIGTGLIGGSLALALKRNKMAQEIVGVSRHKETLKLAKRKGIIDRGSLDLAIVRNSDLVVFATPVSVILGLAPKVSRLIKDECIVIDVGSTKEEISLVLNKLFKRYVGCHPLAGSEKRGAINATAELFRDSLCLITPLKNTDPAALRKIRKLWSGIGARIIVSDPGLHDKALSRVSHLPHLTAFSLINAVPEEYLKFAPLSLRETTRIAASDERLWKDIFLSNKKNILQAIGVFKRNISFFESALLKADSRRLSVLLKRAKRKRQRIG